MAQSTMFSGSEVEIKVRYDRHGTERVCVFFEHLANLACYTLDSFSRLVKSNVPHLNAMPSLRIDFLDKDLDWVELTDTSFPKFVKSVKCDVSEDPKLQIKVADGASPAVIKPVSVFRTSDSASTYPSASASSKRSLDSDFESCAKKGNIKAYTSPIELDIAQKEEELDQKQYEYTEYSARYSSLEESFGLNVFVDKSMPVCGRCHLRISKGHNKRSCQNRACADIRQCGNLDFHADKKAELKEYEKLRDQAGAAVKRINDELTAKRRVRDSLNSTFESKIHSHLINSNPERYLIDGSRVRNIVLNSDKAILRKDFNGKVPKDIDVAAPSFQTIIDTYESQHKFLKKPKTTNPTFDMLKSNSQYNVNIPPSLDAPAASSSFFQHSTSGAMQSPMFYYPPMLPYFWYGAQTVPDQAAPLRPTSPPPMPPQPPPPPEEPDTENP